MAIKEGNEDFQLEGGHIQKDRTSGTKEHPCFLPGGEPKREGTGTFVLLCLKMRGKRKTEKEIPTRAVPNALGLLRGQRHPLRNITQTRGS